MKQTDYSRFAAHAGIKGGCGHSDSEVAETGRLSIWFLIVALAILALCCCGGCCDNSQAQDGESGEPGERIIPRTLYRCFMYSISLVKIEGHDYYIYSGYGYDNGSMIHSEGCRCRKGGTAND